MEGVHLDAFKVEDIWRRMAQEGWLTVPDNMREEIEEEGYDKGDLEGREAMREDLEQDYGAEISNLVAALEDAALNAGVDGPVGLRDDMCTPRDLSVVVYQADKMFGRIINLIPTEEDS